MTLKDQIASDLEDGAVWFNENEFADWHTVNGARVLCEIGALDNAPHTVRRLIGGIVRDSSYLLIRTREFRTKPRSDQGIEIDGTSYRISNVMEDIGVYVITYGRYDDADIRRQSA